MSNLDRLIEEALDEEDRAVLDKFGEQGVFAQTFGVFRGKTAWMSALLSVIMVFLFAGGVYCGYRFATAVETSTMLRWGAAAWLLLSGVIFLKLWFWMQMQTNQVLREVKRVELQIARIQSRMTRD